jgi:hypothetical protein
MHIILHHLEPHRFAPRPCNSLGGAFRCSYYARPWALVSVLLREVRAVVRRGLRGWDDSDVWSLDYHLAAILPSMLRHLNQTKHGTPVWCLDPDPTNPSGYDTTSDRGHQRFAAWLERKASAFEEWTHLMEEIAPADDPRWSAVRAEFHDLFCVEYHFESLWD